MKITNGGQNGLSHFCIATVRSTVKGLNSSWCVIVPVLKNAIQFMSGFIKAVGIALE